jgi:hypothetical protein
MPARNNGCNIDLQREFQKQTLVVKTRKIPPLFSDVTSAYSGVPGHGRGFAPRISPINAPHTNPSSQRSISPLRKSVSACIIRQKSHNRPNTSTGSSEQSPSPSNSVRTQRSARGDFKISNDGFGYWLPLGFVRV